MHEQTVTGHNVRYVLVAAAIGVEDGDPGRDIVRPLATLSQGTERPTTPRVVEMK